MGAKSKRRDKAGRNEINAFVIIGNPSTAGQSGDIQGLSNTAEFDSESVEELVEEGQSFEAAAIDGIESAPDADAHEVTTKQVSADDVPEEYLDTG